MPVLFPLKLNTTAEKVGINETWRYVPLGSAGPKSPRFNVPLWSSSWKAKSA